jgi:hypothetical protein
MDSFTLQMRALPDGQTPTRLELQCFSILHTTISPKTTRRLPPTKAATMIHNLYLSHLSINNVKAFLWTLWSVGLDVEKQVEKGGEEWKMVEEIVERLKEIEEKINWEGNEMEWKRLPGLNWVRHCPEDPRK